MIVLHEDIRDADRGEVPRAVALDKKAPVVAKPTRRHQNRTRNRIPRRHLVAAAPRAIGRGKH
jgi:hypothetical protein